MSVELIATGSSREAKGGRKRERGAMNEWMMFSDLPQGLASCSLAKRSTSVVGRIRPNRAVKAVALGGIQVS
jgi:hypothetical protein